MPKILWIALPYAFYGLHKEKRVSLCRVIRFLHKAEEAHLQVLTRSSLQCNGNIQIAMGDMAGNTQQSSKQGDCSVTAHSVAELEKEVAGLRKELLAKEKETRMLEKMIEEKERVIQILLSERT